MEEKNVGFALLGVGIVIMFVSFIIVVSTFLNLIPPIQILNIPAPSINLSSFLPKFPGVPATNQEMQLIPTTAFNKMLNMGLELVLMYFILAFGFKLADLGVKLLRPIKISEK